MRMMRSDQSRTEYNESWMLAGRLAERQLIESGDANVCVTTSARRSPLRLDEQHQNRCANTERLVNEADLIAGNDSRLAVGRACRWRQPYHRQIRDRFSLERTQKACALSSENRRCCVHSANAGRPLLAGWHYRDCFTPCSARQGRALSRMTDHRQKSSTLQ